jgi:hypothetical protein
MASSDFEASSAKVARRARRAHNQYIAQISKVGGCLDRIERGIFSDFDPKSLHLSVGRSHYKTIVGQAGVRYIEAVPLPGVRASSLRCW